MDNNTQTPMGTIPPTNMDGNMQKKSGIGAVIATVVIIAIIILGALYFWGKRIENQKLQEALVQGASTSTDTSESASAIEATKIETVSQDDSLNTINAELKTTNTTNLSPELQ
jgi:uncharacterized protein HemX